MRNYTIRAARALQVFKFMSRLNITSKISENADPNRLRYFMDLRVFSEVLSGWMNSTKLNSQNLTYLTREATYMLTQQSATLTITLKCFLYLCETLH